MTEALLPYAGPSLDLIEEVARREIKAVVECRSRVDQAVLSLRDVVKSVGYDPDDERGTINDFSTVWRLQLLVECYRFHALGFRRWTTGFLEGAYAAFPASELCITEPERVNANYWRGRWAANGGRIYDGRMVAMKADPIWSRVSVFGLPWEPTDCIGGTAQRDLSHKETIGLGVTWSEAIPVMRGPSTQLFYFDALPEWEGEWSTLKSLVRSGN